MMENYKNEKYSSFSNGNLMILENWKPKTQSKAKI